RLRQSEQCDYLPKWSAPVSVCACGGDAFLDAKQVSGSSSRSTRPFLQASDKFPRYRRSPQATEGFFFRCPGTAQRQPNAVAKIRVSSWVPPLHPAKIGTSMPKVQGVLNPPQL